MANKADKTPQEAAALAAFLRAHYHDDMMDAFDYATSEFRRMMREARMEPRPFYGADFAREELPSHQTDVTEERKLPVIAYVGQYLESIKYSKKCKDCRKGYIRDHYRNKLIVCPNCGGWEREPVECPF